MGEENWPENVIKSKGVLDGGKSYDDPPTEGWFKRGDIYNADGELITPGHNPHETELGGEGIGTGYCDDHVAWGHIVSDGPRPIICADCGKPIMDGLVFHMKPEVYAITIDGETFYLERHIGLSCGCAAKRGLAFP